MTPRANLAAWVQGDRDLLQRHFSGATAEEKSAAAALGEQYRRQYPDAHPTRIQFEAILDVAAASLGKNPLRFMEWLRGFDDAADEIMRSWE